LTAVEDHVPEIDEVHNLTLTKTTPHDGVLSSANFSGASVDEESALTFVTIRGNDKPNGVLQVRSYKTLCGRHILDVCGFFS